MFQCSWNVDGIEKFNGVSYQLIVGGRNIRAMFKYGRLDGTGNSFFLAPTIFAHLSHLMSHTSLEDRGFCDLQQTAGLSKRVVWGLC